MKLRNAIKQSCDTYFYEVARRLGVDRLNLTAKKFGLGNKVLEGIFPDEKVGLVPSTKWKKKIIRKRMGLRRNSNYRNWPGLYSNNTFTIMLDDGATCKWRV